MEVALRRSSYNITSYYDFVQICRAYVCMASRVISLHADDILLYHPMLSGNDQPHSPTTR